ncbi:MAG: 3'(2'),5'-bisphosphate nucleotidase CysQ [Bacteroidales bacterium]|nr:3'(2'),5'-bisphosphate nucleotidase CysQ [Bacteroidales bacterium]
MIMDLLKKAIKAAIAAGAEINFVYESGFIETTLKKDKSPVTNADLKSNKIINDNLKVTGIPVLSEENKTVPYNERKSWKSLWIVDPLDGTKEFLKRNGEFTVNIALVINNKPVLGVIYAPVTKELYFGCPGMGSFRAIVEDKDQDTERIIEGAVRLPSSNQNSTNTIVVSRSHIDGATEEYIRSRSGPSEKTVLVSRGSALKICMVAEGTARYYPRFGPTMEWDIAAGHAIAQYAGKTIRRIDDGGEISYNKENLLNPDFIVE